MKFSSPFKGSILLAIALTSIWGALAEETFPSFDKDVPVKTQKLFLDDLRFIYSIEGSLPSPLHQTVFGEISGKSYRSYFSSRVKSVGMANDEEIPTAVAFVDSSEGSDSSKMWLTDNYFKFNYPQVARTMIIFHEARHSEVENENWSHVDCPDPFLDENHQEILSILTGFKLNGLPGCDDSALGAYGTTVIMLKNLQTHCANCSEKFKMDAGIYGDDQIKRIIRADAKRQLQDDLRR